MRRRLVILGSDLTALAVVRSAHRLGITPIVVDTELGIATSSRFAEVNVFPSRQREELIREIVALAQPSPSFLIATADAWLQVLAAHRAALESAYTRALHPPNDVLAVCLSKEKFAVWCRSHGLPAPQYYPISADFRPDDPTLRFPLLLRPAETLHSHATMATFKAAEVRSPEELARRLEDIRHAGARPVLCESLLARPLRQYSVGFARCGPRMLTVVAQKLRPLPESCAQGSLVETTEDTVIEVLARHVAELFDYQGIGEIEVLHDEVSRKNFLIEVNARPWLQFALGAATGRDLLRLMVDEDRTADDQPSMRKQSARWIDFRSDARACFKRPQGLVPARRLTLSGYVRSVARANVFARWSLADMGPFWRDLLDLIRSRSPELRILNRSARAPGP